MESFVEIVTMGIAAFWTGDLTVVRLLLKLSRRITRGGHNVTVVARVSGVQKVLFTYFLRTGGWLHFRRFYKGRKSLNN